jgi:hypothetical protein
MTLSYQVDFRGFPACPCLAEWLPVYEAELHRRGLLTGALHIYQLIGGAPASGGTHTKGGAFDVLDVLPDVSVARQMGADATWERPVNWDGHGGMRHIHGVLTGCPHNGPARYQIDAVRAGFNGLGLNGHGAPDTGPRPLSGRTWQQGIQWAKEQAAPKEPVVIDTPYTRTRARLAAAVNHPDARAIAKGRLRFRALLATIRAGLAATPKS